MTTRTETDEDGTSADADSSAAAEVTPTARAVGVGTVVAAVVAVAINLLVFVVGNAGAPVEVITGWAPDGAPLTVGEVVGTTVVSVGIGGLALWVASTRWQQALSGWMVLVAVVAVASAVPLWRLDVGTDSKLALTTMHLATGGVVMVSQRWAARR